MSIHSNVTSTLLPGGLRPVFRPGYYSNVTSTLLPGGDFVPFFAPVLLERHKYAASRGDVLPCRRDLLDAHARADHGEQQPPLAQQPRAVHIG